VADPTFVIVGAGLAGATAATTLRTEGFEGRVVLIGDESHAPYSRPPLSKAVLRSESPVEKTFLRPPTWYADHDIDLRLGTTVTAVDPAARTVTLADGGTVAYDRLLLATGGRPRRLDVPGADLPGVFLLRTIDDALALREHLVDGAPVVVVGAGFIGAEVAASARLLGAEVTMLEIADVPLGRALGPTIGDIYAGIHRERGVELRTGIGIDRIAGDRRVDHVVASDGQVHAATAVLIGVGLAPDLHLAAEAGLEIDNGVLVDDFCETSARGVYAAGDIANHPNPYLGHRVRLEHWQNAQHQGAAAARNMFGKERPFHEVPWVWSDQYEHNLQLTGYPDAADQVIVRGDVDRRDFSAFYLRDGRLTGAVAVNRPQDVREARTMVQHQARPEAQALADPSTALAELAQASLPVATA
jgi:3-phenylpropionate/trans-cinnamate dioxygenase ferredoxin reductase component